MDGQAEVAPSPPRRIAEPHINRLLLTDEVAEIGGHTYTVQSRAYLPAEGAAELARLVSAKGEQVPELIGKLVRLGPALLAGAAPAPFSPREAAVPTAPISVVPGKSDGSVVNVEGTLSVRRTLITPAPEPTIEQGALISHDPAGIR